MLTLNAPAKLNLTLHITGQRDDGYHLLDSLVVFAGSGDTLTFSQAPDLALSVSGPFAKGVPTDETNLILRAARTLQQVRGVTQGAMITLDKKLPHAAGIGSGSSDAATTLTALARLWGVAPLAVDAPQVTTLGADVPVCLAGPAPQQMRGIGDVLSPVPAIPSCAVVLINPGIAVPTRAVFEKLPQKTNPAMTSLHRGLDFAGFIDWLSCQRNDLQGPATDQVPEVAQVLDVLTAQPDVAWAGMSGSGATCVALLPKLEQAQKVAAHLRQRHRKWWVVAAQVM